MQNEYDKLKSAYDRQIKSGDPENAWQRFEPMLETKKEPDRGILFLLFLGLGFGLILISIKVLNSPNDFTPETSNSYHVNNENTIERNEKILKTSIINDEVDREQELGNDIRISAKQKAPESSSTITEPIEIEYASSEILQRHKKSTEPSENQKQSNNSDNAILTQKSIAASKIEESNHNKFFFLESIDRQPGLLRTDRSKKEIFVKDDPKDLSNQHDEQLRNLSFGILTGVGKAYHRSIVSSQNINIGVEVDYLINNHVSSFFAVDYMKMNFNTLVNSRELRINSIDLKSSSGSMEYVDVDNRIFDASLGFRIHFLKTEKLNGFVGAGVSQKWAMMQTTNHVLKEMDKLKNIVSDINDVYRYPLYNTFNVGLQIKASPLTDIQLGAQYEQILFNIASAHPKFINCSVGLFKKL